MYNVCTNYKLQVFKNIISVNIITLVAVLLVPEGITMSSWHLHVQHAENNNKCNWIFTQLKEFNTFLDDAMHKGMFNDCFSIQHRLK